MRLLSSDVGAPTSRIQPFRGWGLVGDFPRVADFIGNPGLHDGIPLGFETHGAHLGFYCWKLLMRVQTGKPAAWLGQGGGRLSQMSKLQGLQSRLAIHALDTDVFARI